MQNQDLSGTRFRIARSLFIAQSFFSASTIAAFTLSPIIASALAGSEAAAGFPNTLGLVGRAAFAYPFGYLMDRLGRRLALSGGYALAVVGALISAYAIVQSSYAAFLLGALLVGMSRTSGDQSRYVAAEVYPLKQRARVIGWIIAAGTIGAVLGPQLVEPSGLWMAALGFEAQAATWMGPFVVASVAMLASCLIVFFFLRPEPRDIGRIVAAEEAAQNKDSLEANASARTMGQIFASPTVRLSVLSMAIAYFVMSFLMVITPVHMSNHGHSVRAIANVIMLHTLGMFGLSWFTGSLIDRFGRISMIYAGAGILMTSAIIAPLSTSMVNLMLALFLLGLGWNFAYVAGSSLLSDAVNSAERARAQGVGETIVALSSGTSSLSVGFAYGLGDYTLVASIGFALVSVLIVSAFVLSRQAKRDASKVLSV